MRRFALLIVAAAAPAVFAGPGIAAADPAKPAKAAAAE